MTELITLTDNKNCQYVRGRINKVETENDIPKFNESVF